MVQVDIESLNSSEVRHGWINPVPVGTPTRLCPRGPAAPAKGVVLYCPPDNTAPIYWGVTENIQADRSPLGGIELRPGSSFTVPANEPSEIFVVAAQADQVLGYVTI